MRRDLLPQFTAGHSLGEYSALVASGSLTFRDAVRIVRLRGRFMQEAVPVGEGAMAAILGMEQEEVENFARKWQEMECLLQLIIIVRDKSSSPAIRRQWSGRSKGVNQKGKRAVAPPCQRALPFAADERGRGAVGEKNWKGFRSEDLKIPVVTNVEAEINAFEGKGETLVGDAGFEPSSLGRVDEANGSREELSGSSRSVPEKFSRV